MTQYRCYYVAHDDTNLHGSYSIVCGQSLKDIHPHCSCMYILAGLKWSRIVGSCRVMEVAAMHR